MIAFTGSTEIGRHLMRSAAQDLKKLVLELGGHTPMVIFKDANLDRAVADGVKRSFRNMGQICNAVNRIYVEEDFAEEYIRRFVEMTGKLTIGDGLANPNVDLGPMIDQEGIERVKGGRREAKELVAGGVEQEEKNLVSHRGQAMAKIKEESDKILKWLALRMSEEPL